MRRLALTAAAALLGLTVLVVVMGHAQRRTNGYGDAGCGNQVVRFAGAVWHCTFDEEFGGNGVDPRRWQVLRTAQIGFHSGQECFVADSEHVGVADGLLRLTMSRSSQATLCAGSFVSPYRSGMITTMGRFAQTYGRVAVRARLPHEPGIQAAIWMYPAQLTYGAWPRSGEIDIAEVFGEPAGEAWPHLHYADATGAEAHPGQACRLRASSSGFHTYAVDWTASAFRFSYDGRTCFTFAGWTPAPPMTAPAPFDRPFYLLLELATGAVDNPSTPSTRLPESMFIDYVRAWG